jgi:hypothetical protein
MIMHKNARITHSRASLDHRPLGEHWPLPHGTGTACAASPSSLGTDDVESVASASHRKLRF